MRDSGTLERMRTKKFFIGFAFVVISSGTIWLLNSPPPAHENVVFRSQKGIRNVHIQFPTNQVTVNPTYLSHLGLKESRPGKVVGSGEKPSSTTDNASLDHLQPVIATSVDREDWESVHSLIKSITQHMPGYHLVVFDLTSSEMAPAMLQKYCNSSWNCEVRRFQFENYPSHVADLSIKSYRPICIQEMLYTYGAVIWADSVEYFKTGQIRETLERAKGTGLAAWTIEHPTSAITHSKMFHFFGTRQDRYYFHRAVESSHLIVVNSPRVKEKIMLPWVKCALLEDCISPRGAQHTGCNFMRKPLFKYSGCHFYDMSALNVILGSAFDFDERAYAANQTIFGNLIDDQLAAKNTSDPLHRSRLKMREYLTGRIGTVSS